MKNIEVTLQNSQKSRFNFDTLIIRLVTCRSLTLRRTGKLKRLCFVDGNYYQLITEGSLNYQKFVAVTENQNMHFQLKAPGQADASILQ